MGKYPRLLYRKVFTLPKEFIKNKVLLHFGAVDQIAKIKLNGVLVGVHRGGYDSFSIDISDNLLEKNLLEVQVTDEMENKILPYGKQRRKRGGMWYTPISGIWQTVWLESVPDNYIRSIRIETGPNYADIIADAPDGVVILKNSHNKTEHEFKDGRAHVVLKNPKLWSPQDPYLYRFILKAGEDEVESYFALRTLEITEIDGKKRLCLNGKPYFFHGLLDQGYYSDGIFLPASHENYTRDITTAKSLGFNTLRKHIKIEPDVFYYECDRLGMIVFQDMVNNGRYSFLRDTALPTVGFKRLPNIFRVKSSKIREAFLEQMKKTVNQLYNHPSVCYYTIFNEGWGQLSGDMMYNELKRLDQTRFIDTTSGWFKTEKSDVNSVHCYFKRFKLKKVAPKPTVLSEFGGYSLKIDGHYFNNQKNYGYKLFKTKEEYQEGVEKLYREEIIPQIPMGLCGAIYTQLSDVEDETNGVITYDRHVIKLDKEVMQKISQDLKI